VERQNSSSSAKPTKKSAPEKKEKGSLFSSFAKAKPKLKKEESSTPATSGAESVSLGTIAKLQCRGLIVI
jgi:DNA polymerase delta subunit 3